MRTVGASDNEQSVRHVNEVQPGSCDPYLGCPPPTEIVCIKVDKVYYECKNIQVNEDEFTFYPEPECPVLDVSCYNVELYCEPCCEVVKPGLVSVTFRYKVTVRLFFPTTCEPAFKDLCQVVTVTKLFNIPRAGEEGLHVQCYVPFLECLDAFISAVDPETGKVTIIACVGKYILIKLKATVQLMVPAYGFCPEPPDCDEVFGICPDFRPEWPPYPPQIR
ncbi:MAG: hypothetical protein DDT19_00382 [Syntrophomonadaceae bacterium]|nr:hypothetical protein [Bacillota bacterium]